MQTIALCLAMKGTSCVLPSARCLVCEQLVGPSCLHGGISINKTEKGLAVISSHKRIFMFCILCHLSGKMTHTVTALIWMSMTKNKILKSI